MTSAADPAPGRRPIDAALVLIAAAACAGCFQSVGGKSGSLQGQTMGTVYAVRYFAPVEFEPSPEELQQAIDDRLALVNKRMSTYDPESELSRFNASESTDWFAVSVETASVVESALELADSSGGTYDPTVGPLVNLWGFGPGKRRDAPPSEEEIKAAKASTGYCKVDARLDPPALRKDDPGVYVDLSSIAKGHGVDAVAEVLDGLGCSQYLVEIGGEVRSKGTKPGGKPWRIGVEKAAGARSASGRPLQRVVELVDRSMATSGDYRNFFEYEGQRFSHTISPARGKPVSHDLATVTVTADRCRDADAVATALLVMGPERGYDWAAERGVAALFVSRSAADELTERTTPAWDQLHGAPEP